MTPKEKAKEIWDKMIYHIMYNCQPTLSEMVAKECALIAVDEVILEQCKSSEFKNPIYQDERLRYWNEVKQEIEKL